MLVVSAILALAVAGLTPPLGFAAAGSWNIVASPNATAFDNRLNSVSCATSSDRGAVGNYYPTSCCTDRTLIEQNPGGGWGVAGSPNATTVNNNSLHGVTCVTPTDCWAVGSYDFSNRVSTEVAPLIQHRTASGWKIVGSPNPTGSDDSELSV